MQYVQSCVFFYIDGDAKKESGYTIYYLAINVGGALAPLVYGTMVYFVNWNFVFLCNVVTIILGLLLFLINLKFFPNKEFGSQFVKSSKKLLIDIIIILVVLAISLIFYFFNFINFIVSLLYLLNILYIITMIVFKFAGKIRRRLLSVLGLSFFSTFYYAAGLQVGTTITLFIQQKINEVVIDFRLLASTFSTLYCLFILLLAPFMTTT